MGHHLMTAEDYFSEIVYVLNFSMEKKNIFSHPNLGMCAGYMTEGGIQWKVQVWG